MNFEIGDQVVMVKQHIYNGRLWDGNRECEIGSIGTITRHVSAGACVKWQSHPDEKIGYTLTVIDESCLAHYPQAPSEEEMQAVYASFGISS